MGAIYSLRRLAALDMAKVRSNFITLKCQKCNNPELYKKVGHPAICEKCGNTADPSYIENKTAKFEIISLEQASYLDLEDFYTRRATEAYFEEANDLLQANRRNPLSWWPD